MYDHGESISCLDISDPKADPRINDVTRVWARLFSIFAIGFSQININYFLGFIFRFIIENSIKNEFTIFYIGFLQ